MGEVGQQLTFHVEHSTDSLDRVLSRLGLAADQARSTLARYGDWLATEAIKAGGLGPAEADRVMDRHLADSLAFAFGFPDGKLPPNLVDVGSGVGLPGIPLAVGFPATQVVLLDRSGRRCDLARRAVRMLRLSNVAVHQLDVAGSEGTLSGVVGVGSTGHGLTFRAALALLPAAELVARWLQPSEDAVFGLSRTRRPDTDTMVRVAQDAGVAARVVEIEPDVLDSPAWLLRMTPL